MDLRIPQLEQLFELIANLGAKFAIGKLRRIANLFLLFVFLFGGVIFGLGGLSLCLKFHAGAFATVIFACFAFLLTVGPFTGWLIIRRLAPQAEAKAAAALEGYGRRVTEGYLRPDPDLDDLWP